ncbi:MAG: Hsp70 family protein [Patescibacteria group bacterium]
MKDIFYGFDFGTSNCSISVSRNGIVRLIPIALDGGMVVPSTLYYTLRGKECHIGQEAARQYVKNQMRGRFMQSIKTLLPDESFDGTMITGVGYKQLEDLIATIMVELKSRADKYVGTNVNSVVLGRPAKFSNDPQIEIMATERLLTAAYRAGFTEVKLQLEPIAAAFHYESLLNRDETVLVADLGGGTSDFTIVKLSPGRRLDQNRSGDILGSLGVSIGGDKFDSDIMRAKLLPYFGSESTYLVGGMTSPIRTPVPMPKQILDRITQWEHIVFLKTKKIRIQIDDIYRSSSDQPAVHRLRTLIEENLGYSLFSEIESTKRTLSTKNKAQLKYNQADIHIREIITRSEFEMLISYAIAEFDRSVEQLLTVCDCTPEQIDSVFLTGGTSIIPLIRTWLSNKFGSTKIKVSDTFTSVSAGLGNSSYLFN